MQLVLPNRYVLMTKKMTQSLKKESERSGKLQYSKLEKARADQLVEDDDTLPSSAEKLCKIKKFETSTSNFNIPLFLFSYHRISATLKNKKLPREGKSESCAVQHSSIDQ